MELLLGLCVGIGLSAACGFRVFIPLLGLSIAANAGHVELAESFQWIGSPVAIVALSLATVLEIGAYYIPWLDNLLDSAATPAAIIGGTIMTGAMTGDISPFMKWSMAIIAGGGTAGIVQAGTVLVRGASTATTGGVGNPVVSTGELAGATVTTILAIVLPILAGVLVLGLLVWMIMKICKKKNEPEVVYEGELRDSGGSPIVE